MCLLFVVIGAILGGLIGNLLENVSALSSLLPYLVAKEAVFSVQPIEIHLFVLSLTVGFSFTPNLMSMLGAVVALLLYRRY